MTDPLAKPATKYTKEANSYAAALINFDDDGDFRRAQQGLIATHETGRIELAIERLNVRSGCNCEEYEELKEHIEKN